jgi:TM2 domain-containing membrane protein YozV
MSSYQGDEAAQYQTREQALGYGAGAPPPALPQPYGYGYGQPMMPHQQQVQARSAAVAVIASLFIPGLGTMLSGRPGKGVLILACFILAAISSFFIIGFILSPVVWIYGMVAANNDTHKWNRAHGIIS